MKKLLVFCFLLGGCAVTKEAYSNRINNVPVEQNEMQGRKKDVLDISKIKTKYLDIPYADLSKAQNLDIYLPEAKKDSYPVIVFIHGGAWLSGDKRENFSAPILRSLKEGYAVASINYRLSGEAEFPAAIEDAKAAIRFIRANAEKYNLDPNRIAVFGRSSGANLASLVGTTSGTDKFDNPLLGNKDVSSKVSAVVAWFPPVDLLSMDSQLKALGIQGQTRGAAVEGTKNIQNNDEVHGAADSPASLYMGAKISTVPKLVEENNPTTYITKNVPPFLIEHGTIDNVVPITQSRSFVKELKAKSKNEVEYFEVEGAKHGGPKFDTEENLDRVFKFLNSAL